MSVTENLKVQRFNFQSITSAGTYSFTVRVDNLYSTNDYWVESFETPQGPYVENIPLPEQVIQDIVDAITSIKGQNIGTIHLGATSYSYEATEGGGNPAGNTLSIDNTGDWGSLLGLTMTPSQSWITATPSTLGNIAKGEAKTTVVQALTGNLTAAGSPYSGTVTVADPNASNTPQTVSISFVVLPKPLISIVPTGTPITFSTTYGVNPPSQYFTVANGGPATSKLNWTAQKVTGVNWLTVTPTSGGPMLNTDAPVVVNLLVDVIGTNLSAGQYVETVRISDSVASNNPITVEVRLTVL